MGLRAGVARPQGADGALPEDAGGGCGEGLEAPGSGIWGPEQTDVMKLTLWNRIKQKRPQREVPTLEIQDHLVLEFAIIWWTCGIIFVMGPLLWWAKKYRMAHDHYPWGPARLDGSKGPGAFIWFLE